MVNLAPLLVVALLTIGAWRQFVPAGRWGQLWDMVALVPQWRFYAQNGIAEDEAWFDDPHLLVRTAASDRQGDWEPVFWLEERSLLEAVWNPRRRAREHLVEFMELLSEQCGVRADVPVHSLPYLAILRLCLELVPLPAGTRLQFAVVRARGRGERQPALGFLSQWHTP